MAKSCLLSLYQIKLDDSANTSMVREAIFFTPKHPPPAPINLPKFKTDAHTQSGSKSSLDPLGTNEIIYHAVYPHPCRHHFGGLVCTSMHRQYCSGCESARYMSNTHDAIFVRKETSLSFSSIKRLVLKVLGLFQVYILLTSGFKGIFQSTTYLSSYT